MKILKSLLAYVGCALLALNFAACKDWGESDPEAGNQVYPDRTVVTTFPFEYGEGDELLGDISSTTDVCEVFEDETLASNVLHIDANGYAKIANPFNGVKLQNGAGITFWLKTAGIPSEAAEGEDPVVADDLTGAVLAFGSDAAGAERFYFTTNGQLKYTKPGNLESLDLNENDPATYQTGILPAGEWHFVALQIADDGYQLYIDGQKSLSGSNPSGAAATTFSYETLVDFINTAPYIYIGKGAGDDDVNMSEMWIEDIRLVRNQMISSDWAMPNKGNIGGGGSEIFEYLVEDPINTVGAVDNSSAWWTEFSNYFRIPTEATMHFQFVNHTSGAGNWNNWNLCVATDVERGGAGYEEYFVVRSDLYGWGGAYNAENWSSVGYGDWDQFRADMEGAIVDVVISRQGAEVYMTATATCPNGKVYQESFHATCGDGSQVIRAFFIVDGSHLDFNWDNCFVQENVDVATMTIGATDNSTAWWTAFSDYFSIPVDKALVLNFTNHTSGAGNWNNWNLCVSTDAERGGAGYEEYFVIRSDLYGWGGAYNAENWSSVGYGDWDQFRADMEGAAVELTISRQGAEAYVTAIATCPNGTTYQENFHATCGDGTQTIRAFLIVDGSHLVMDPTNCYLKELLIK